MPNVVKDLNRYGFGRKVYYKQCDTWKNLILQFKIEIVRLLKKTVSAVKKLEIVTNEALRLIDYKEKIL